MAHRPLIRILLLVAISCFAGCQCSEQNGSIEIVTIADEEFRLEIANNEESREQGLMGRTEIANDGGMLFVFPDAQIRSFWMGHCVIDIDLLFLDPHGRVTAVHRMSAEPPQGTDETDDAYRSRMPDYWSKYPAQFVIELKSGTIDRLGIGFDDKINLDVERLKAAAQ